MNFISINFGELDLSKEDLWDCFKTYSANVLISDTSDNYYVQISYETSTLHSFESIEQVFDFYADFILSKELMNYSKPFLSGLMQCTYDEDIDALYDILETQGGDVQFAYDGDFNFSGDTLNPIISSFPNAPFCIMQTSEIGSELKDEKIILEDNSIELKELFGFINYLESKSAIYIN